MTVEAAEMLSAIGVATLILCGIAILLASIGIAIEESSQKVKFWRLIWRKFRAKYLGEKKK